MGDDSVANRFTRYKHIAFLKRCLFCLPSDSIAIDSTRVTVVLFSVSGLDLLNSLSAIEDLKDDISSWIYSLQVLPTSGDELEDECSGGFRGGLTECGGYSPQGTSVQHPFDCATIGQTYSALASLLILGNSLDRIDRAAVIRSVQRSQQEDGSFSAVSGGDSPGLVGESDMRFVYCACCISYMLDDWSGVDIPRCVDYIKRSVNYDGGLGQGPECESHGGSTFCALASLTLMGRDPHTVFTQRQVQRMVRWCLNRQDCGYHGRPNKPDDTCYSFWIGASLTLLSAFELGDRQENAKYILSTQDQIVGGLAKWADSQPDPLHTYFGLCGLSLVWNSEKTSDNNIQQGTSEASVKGTSDMLRPMFVALNMSERAVSHIHSLHATWSKTGD